MTIPTFLHPKGADELLIRLWDAIEAARDRHGERAAIEIATLALDTIQERTGTKPTNSTEELQQWQPRA